MHDQFLIVSGMFLPIDLRLFFGHTDLDWRRTERERTSWPIFFVSGIFIVHWTVVMEMYVFVSDGMEKALTHGTVKTTPH